MELAAMDRRLFLLLLDHARDRTEEVAGPDRRGHTYCTIGDRQGACDARELGGILVLMNHADTHQEACPSVEEGEHQES